MALVKIGDSYFNLEQASHIIDYIGGASGNLIEVYVGAERVGYCVEAEATALRQYLATVAIDPSSPEYTDPDWLEYKDNQGDMSYAQWADTKDRLASHLAKSEKWQDANRETIASLESDLKL